MENCVVIPVGEITDSGVDMILQLKMKTRIYNTNSEKESLSKKYFLSIMLQEHTNINKTKAKSRNCGRL